MPKIPTFTSEARPTAEVGSVKSNLQIPLSQTLANAVSPLTDYVVKKAVQETNTQNKSEALRLENDYIRDMQEVNDYIINDKVLGTNKAAANAYYKEKSNALISKYRSQASNGAIQTLFSNNALTEVQKGIYRVEKQINKNVFKQLSNEVEVKENHLLSQAILGENNDFDYGVLQTDLTKLYTDAYSGVIPYPKLEEIINAIPGTIETFQANKDIGDNPRLAFQELTNKDSKIYSNIPIEKRQKLIQNAKGILIPEIEMEWKNYTAAAALGKEPVKFDLEFAKKILPPKTIIQMKNQLKVIDKTIKNTETLNSVPSKDLASSQETIFKEIDMQVESKTIDFITAQNKKKYYNKIIETRTEMLAEDAALFVLQTNDSIKDFAAEIANETNPKLVNEMNQDLANRLVKAQIALGVPSYNVKVMTKDSADQWVVNYQNGDQNTRVAMLQTLDQQFGDNNSAAMLQLLDAGLPTTAELSSYFNNPNITKIFLSFDDDKEKEKLKQFGKDNDPAFKFNTLRSDIRSDKDIKAFENIIALNGGENSSIAADKMDNIVETLAYYTLNDMFVNGTKETVARKKAIALITNSFQVEGSYYVPVVLDGKRLNQSQVDAVIDKATVIKEHYLSEFKAVPFGSMDKEINDLEITEQFNVNLQNGEWRNTADGTSLIYGIVLADGAFSPVQNANDEFLEFRIDSFEDYTLPGTDIQMNMQLKKPVQEEDNSASLAIDDRLRYVDSNMIMSDATSYTGANDQPSFLNYMKKVENSSIINKTPKSFRHSSPEGGLDTVGFGHKLTAEEQKTNTIYGYNIDTLTIEQVNDIFQQDINKAEQVLIKNYGDKYNNLDDRRKQMLIDMQFNVRNFNKPNVFPKFKKALFAGDEEGMKKEYKRFYKDQKGKMKSLARNKDFADYFFN